MQDHIPLAASPPPPSATMPPLTEDARNAMRSFLARAEVRLSTMHRIAGSFLGGAALLLLLPVFFGQGIAEIVMAGMKHLNNLGKSEGQVRMIVICSGLATPFLISTLIPLYSLYLLIKDIVQFYFIGHSPGFPTDVFHPRLALSGIAFSTDEAPDVKKEILLCEYGTELFNFIVPFDKNKGGYFDALIKQSGDKMRPRGRRLKDLEKSGIVTSDSSEVDVNSNPPVRRTMKEIDYFSTAFGLAGCRDRLLVEEVAKSETSLVRHSLFLRRLVLRYVKAFLIFTWTAIVFFLCVAFLRSEPIASADDAATAAFHVLAIAYLIWSTLAPFIVWLPIRWIYRYSSADAQRIKDPQLQYFERIVKVLAAASSLSALMVLFCVVSLDVVWVVPLAVLVAIAMHVTRWWVSF